MSLNEKFLRDPFGFATTYAIIPRAANIDYGAHGQPYIRETRLSFEPSDFKAGGIAKKAVDLVNSPDGFESYWLPYDPNKSKRLVLGTAKRFMFTANMDGCSFVIGSQTTTGHVLVAHANAADKGGEMFATAQKLGYEPRESGYIARSVQANTQAEMLQKKLAPDPTPTYFGPKDYMSMSAEDDDPDVLSWNATVFGVYESGGWKIYAQRRALMSGKVFVLRGIQRIR